MHAYVGETTVREIGALAALETLFTVVIIVTDTGPFARFDGTVNTGATPKPEEL